jgi:aspartyl-tRNA(Asn)/glutamyl-tRNA(Gln) amidotransferase subunit A
MTYTITSYLQASDHHNIIKQYLSKAQELNESYNACVRRHNDYIQQQQDTQLSRDLKALPVFIKDNILTKGYISSCGSAMLQNYTAPYSASCFSKLEQAGALMLGKANMDEFAMGSSNETSFF